MTRPLIGMISRMVEQKGFDLLEAMEAELASFEATWVVLGTGEARYQQFWTRMASRHPDRICVRIGFDRFAFPSLVAITTPANLASQRVMQKAGLTYAQSLSRLRRAHDFVRDAIGEDAEARLRELLKVG